MVTCADTSFLFSIYGNDTNTPRAMKWLQKNPTGITVSRLNEFELGNALRFSEFKGFIPRGAASDYWKDYHQDRLSGRINLQPVNLADILSTANQLSEKWTLQKGHRSFDILHVATACVCEAKHFLTFDQNQIQLVNRAGIEAFPE